MILQADALALPLKPNSVDMIMTSPPYWGLRDYGIEQIFGGDKDCEHDFSVIHRRANDKSGGHGNAGYIGAEKVQDMARFGPPTTTCSKCQAWKGQLGLEPTPEFYIEHLTEIFNEAKRVLKKEGTLWLNIGDTYSSTRWSDTPSSTGISAKCSDVVLQKETDLPQKCLCMIPERLAWSLIQNGWILRNKIIWYKPNAMLSSVTDRFSNRWEYLFMFSKSQRYFFDLNSVREPHAIESIARDKRGCSGKTREAMNEAQFGNPHGLLKPRKNIKHDIAVGRIGNFSYEDPLHTRELHPSGKNPGDVFEINTQPFPEAHFAVFPEKLCEKPIKAGCPERVCKKCGKARERITKSVLGYGAVKSETKATEKTAHNMKELAERRQYYRSLGYESPPAPKTIGWTSCNCNAGFEGGIVLDPFCGAGTALYVAKEMKRRFIGIDIKQEYCKMAKKRLAQGVL